MSDEIHVPALDEIAAMTPARLQRELTRLCSEIGFINGDTAHGGPPRDELLTRLRVVVEAIAMKLQAFAAAERVDG